MMKETGSRALRFIAPNALVLGFAIGSVLMVSAPPAHAESGDGTDGTAGLFETSSAFAPNDVVIPCSESVAGEDDLLCRSDFDVFVRGLDQNDWPNLKVFRNGDVIETVPQIQATAFGAITGFAQQSGPTHRFCWTFAGPAEQVCVDVASGSCGDGGCETSCGAAGRMTVLQGTAGQSVCTDVAGRVAQTVKTDTGLKFVIGLDTETTGQTGSASVAICSSFVATCADPDAPIANVTRLRQEPLATVFSPLSGRYGSYYF